jgi:glycerol-3-phosphate dehydrogenase
LLKNATGLVREEDFYIPLYKHSQRKPWQIHIGLFLYRCLALFHPMSSFERVPKSRWDSLDHIDQTDLLAVYRYRDARTDDAELTRRVVSSAQSLGVQAREYWDLLTAERQPVGWKLNYQTPTGEQSATAGYVVNAGGPWVNEVAEKFSPTWTQSPIELVRGSHIIVSGELEGGIYYLESAEDGRAVFAIPMLKDSGREGIMLGTTEQTHTEAPDKVVATQAEQDYLLAVFKRYFPDWQGEVLSSFAGLRVLPGGEGRAFSKERDTFFIKQEGGISIYGGKLTAFRHTSERVCAEVNKALGNRAKVQDTRELQLCQTL